MQLSFHSLHCISALDTNDERLLGYCRRATPEGSASCRESDTAASQTTGLCIRALQWRFGYWRGVASNIT